MWSRIARIVFSVAIPAFFLWLFFRSIDPAELARSVQGVGTGWLLLIIAALVQVLHVVMRAARWRILMRPLKKNVRWYNLISTVSIGYMVTMLLPGRVGEVLRPILFARREKISKSGALATILLERLIDGLTVILLLAIYLIFFMGSAGGVAQEAARGLRTGWGAALGAAFLLSLPALWALVHYRAAAARLLGRLYPEGRPGGHAVHTIFQGVVDGFEILKGGRALVGIWLYSFAIWTMIAFSIWFSLLAFDIHIPLPGSLIMMAALVFGIAIPTQGGVGTYEYFGQQALTIFFGVDASQAAAAILVMHVFAISPTILMGLWFLWREGLSLGDLRKEARGVAGEVSAGGQPRGGGPPAAPMAGRPAEGEP